MNGSHFDAVRLPKVEIHATDVCNNRCTFCTTGWLNLEKEDELRHPPRAFIREQLEAAYEKGARRALFQGGEPTVRRDLAELLADAREIGYQATTIFTNARMGASRAGARWLAGMNVTWFQVSIQGGTAEAHDESVAAKGAFEQTISGTRRLIELGQRVKVNGVLTRHLLDTLPEFARLMVELRPEEIGMDTVKPTSAFGPGRESYANLLPRMSDYSEKLASALRVMNDAGVVARLTTFAPCLVPGAEHWCAEESDNVQSATTAGRVVDKLGWKRSLQVKSDECATCAYDKSCGGVYRCYADLHGTGELHALSEERRAPASATRENGAAPEGPGRASPLTHALRALFVRERGGGYGVREVRPLPDGSHELLCPGTTGDLRVRVAPRDDAPAYATTLRFSVRYQNGPGVNPDKRLLDAVVQTLRRAEAYLYR